MHRNYLRTTDVAIEKDEAAWCCNIGAYDVRIEIAVGNDKKLYVFIIEVTSYIIIISLPMLVECAGN